MNNSAVRVYLVYALNTAENIVITKINNYSKSKIYLLHSALKH